MKLSIVRGGGIAGALVPRTEISTDSLAPEDAKTLRTKVQEAGLQEHSDAGDRAAHPEDLLYELTVEDEGDHHTVRIRESALPEAVRSLIAWTDSRPEAKHLIGAAEPD